ncbi:unnamed protein product, partial [Eretmochelys imbricata]
MLLHLFSDANYNLLGFNASYRVSLCPRGCSGHGTCEPHGQCRCRPGWGGPDCAVPPCDSYCLGHGACDQESDRCRCQPGFVGEACDLALGENQGAGRWYNVSSTDPHFRPARLPPALSCPPPGHSTSSGAGPEHGAGRPRHLQLHLQPVAEPGAEPLPA